MKVRNVYNDDLSCDLHDIVEQIYYWIRPAYGEITIFKDDYSDMYYVEAFSFQKMKYQDQQYYSYSEAKAAAAAMKKATFEDVVKTTLLILDVGQYEEQYSN